MKRIKEKLADKLGLDSTSNYAQNIPQNYAYPDMMPQQTYPQQAYMPVQQVQGYAPTVIAQQPSKRHKIKDTFYRGIGKGIGKGTVNHAFESGNIGTIGGGHHGGHHGGGGHHSGHAGGGHDGGGGHSGGGCGGGGCGGGGGS